MIGKVIFLIAPLSLATLTWGDSQDRPNLNGNWRLEPTKCEIHTHMPDQFTWHIDQDDNSIHLVQSVQEKKGDDFKCATDGQDCKVKTEGHSVVMNFYYNGPVLVELESEGQNKDNVVKRRMHLSSDGSTLIVDVMHVSPPGKPAEKLVLTKQ